MAKPEKQETTIGETYNKSKAQKRPQRRGNPNPQVAEKKSPSLPKSYEGPGSSKPKPKPKPKFVATPGTGFKDNSGTNNQPKTVTSGDRAKEALKKAVKTSVGISPFTAKTKKEVVYQADAGKSDYSDSYGTQTSYKKTKKDSSGKVKSTASADLTTGKGNVLPEFELAVTKMYGSPAKVDTVDPTTGQVLPTGMGQGPTNVGNANTAQTLQSQADSAAVKANRAGKPSSTAADITQTPMTMQGNFKNSSMANAARMFGNMPNPVPSPQQFNAGLRKASADGKLNPEFAAKVNAAPIKAKGEPGSGTTLDTFEVNFSKEKGNREGKGSTDGQTTNSRIKKDGTKQSVDTYEGKKAEGTIQASF